jgi:sec-independent protein translocase protein TatA
MLPNIGMSELIVILVIVLLLFGAKRLPDVAKGLGRSLKAFKEGMEEGTKDDKDEKK